MFRRPGITLHFTYRREDFAHAAFANYSSPRRLKFDVAMAIGLIALGLGLRSDAGWSGWLGIVFAGIGLLFLAMLIVVKFFAPTLAIWRNPKLRDEYRLTFAPGGIHFLTRGIESQLQWSFYTRACADEYAWLLYHARNAYTLVPLRVFKNDDERRRFEALVTAHIPRIERR